MLKTFKTLLNGASASAQESVRDKYAIELINQKIREAEGSLRSAKVTLATMVQRQRTEEKLAQGIEMRMGELTQSIENALKDKNEEMALQGAEAVAAMENELETRKETLSRLDQKIVRLRHSVEAGHRRIVELKQGAITAKAVKAEQQIQVQLNNSHSPQNSMEEAEELIATVISKEDPFERAEILSAIENDLQHKSIAQKMADNGYADSTKSTAQDVLNRLKTNS